MANAWKGYALAEDFTVQGSAIEVSFADGRRQLVNVAEGAEDYRLSSFVVKEAKAESIPDLPLQVWKRNRTTAIVGFRIDDRGRSVGDEVRSDCRGVSVGRPHRGGGMRPVGVHPDRP